MTASDSKRSLPSTATMALVAAGLLAVASIAVAVTRGGDEQPATIDSPHGAVKTDQPVGSVEEQIRKLEAKLKTSPDDAAGWRMLGWSLFETGDTMRAAGAYRRAAELEPNNAENWSSLGEALQVSSQQVSPDAAAAFERALKIDPKDPRARYFTAVQKDLGGDHRGAVDAWITLLKETPAGAVWEADLRRTIEQTAAREKIDIAGRMPAASNVRPPASTATAGIPGPSQQDLAAASSIPPGEQDAMVKGMVDRLANRLKENPKDAEGWIRLMRSRMVLGDGKQAASELRSGLAAFAGDSATQGRLRDAARELGVPNGS